MDDDDGPSYPIQRAEVQDNVCVYHYFVGMMNYFTNKSYHHYKLIQLILCRILKDDIK
jgi:hypothetical protein